MKKYLIGSDLHTASSKAELADRFEHLFWEQARENWLKRVNERDDNSKEAEHAFIALEVASMRKEFIAGLQEIFDA
jgi:hypothetical protein